MGTRLDRWQRWHVAACLVAVFVVSRVLVRVSGLRFDASPLSQGWQHIDPPLLKERLAESLLHLHAQPPLFNLFLGSVVKLAGGHDRLAFELAFLAVGALLYGTLFVVMRRVGVSRASAFVVSTLFAISPSVLLYESWLFYALPLALLVGLSALSLTRLLEKKDTGSAALFFASVAALCATHGLFHIVYLLACFAMIGAARLLPLSKLVVSAALPFLVVVGIYGKNAVLFGQFGASTWMGMNLAIHRVDALPEAERSQLVAEGVLSDVALSRPFDPLDAFPRHYAEVPARFAGIPVLAQARKVSGDPNLNHFGYIAISKRYAADTKAVAVRRPFVFARALVRGWHEYFRSSSDYWFLDEQIASSSLVRVAIRVFDLALYGVVLHKTPGLFLIVGIPLLVVASLWAVVHPGRFRALALPLERRLFLIFCAGTVAFVALVANTLNAVENNRLRFMTDPLIVILAAFWLDQWLLPRFRALVAERVRARSAGE